MTAPTRKPWIHSVALSWESDECLPWPFSVRGGQDKGGYPALSDTYGHIYLCTLAHGPAPTPEHEVEHLCNFRRCMNKKHLAWATHKDNCARRTEHGTQLAGEKHNMAKLTVPQVRRIRRAKEVRGGGRRLAEKYEVSPALISLIRRGKLWPGVA